MTATLEAVTKQKDKLEPSAEQKLAEELVARAREQGVALTGPEGLLKQLTKVVLETALNQEMTEHLGHDKRAPAGNEAGNVRNGARPKTVLTESTGEVGIEVPRDRAGTFEPQIVRHRCPDQVHAITGTFGQQVLGVLVQDTVQDRRRRL